MCNQPRLDDVADALGHLAALLIHHETVRDQSAVRCLAVDRNYEKKIDNRYVRVVSVERKIKTQIEHLPDVSNDD